MSKFVLSFGLLLGSLAGTVTQAQACDPGQLPVQTCEVGEGEATLVYGPYFYSDAVAVRNDLSLRGYWTSINLGNDGYWYVYAW